jgi:hypothetical protein
LLLCDKQKADKERVGKKILFAAITPGAFIMTRQQSMGKCSLCGETFGKAAMTRHLSKCSQAQTPAAPANQKTTPAFHLVVEGRWAKAYWLHLAAPANAPLRKLDEFLRRIWLECCGHLSAFAIGGIRYSVSPMEEERGMGTPLSRVVDVGTKFTYEYDYGSTTELELRVVGLWSQDKPKVGVQILARNDPPEIKCDLCKTQPATKICTECQEAWLCASCVTAHECSEEMFLPVVNSTRVGVCGYTG